jgi:dTDP-4-dehydrorhamnose 3,5-epimerase
MSLKHSNFPEIKQMQNLVFIDNRGQIIKLDLPNGNVFDSILISSNNLAGTVRGLHFQKPPFGEVKIVTCVKGSIMDFVLDVRIDSPFYGKWGKFLLNSRDPTSLVIPKGFAHGFQTLQPDTDILYAVSGDFSPSHSVTVNIKDPDLAIELPLGISVISDKDLAGVSLSELTQMRND